MEALVEELFRLDQSLTPEQGNGKILTVVIYDIPDNKRRLRVAKILNGFGKRVQKSAFECIIDKKQYETLIDRLSRVIAEEDLLRVYKIAGQADVKIWGDVALTNFDEDIII